MYYPQVGEHVIGVIPGPPDEVYIGYATAPFDYGHGPVRAYCVVSQPEQCRLPCRNGPILFAPELMPYTDDLAVSWLLGD